MQDLLLYVRLLLGLLFLSTAFSKLRNFEEHVAIVADYKIIPRKFTRLFARSEMGAEFLFSVLLVLGLLDWVATVGILTLLLSYTCAILVNLLRGRTEVSCGCGGAAGNHQLSWWLILRNVVLIAGCGWLLREKTDWAHLQALLQGAKFHVVFPVDVITVLFMAVLSLIVVAMVNELQVIRNWLKEKEQN